MWIRLLAAAVLCACAAPAAASVPYTLHEGCRYAAPAATDWREVSAQLKSCHNPASPNHNGTVWIVYDSLPSELVPPKTWRLILDNHRSTAVDVWLIAADGRRQQYHYDPASPDREWSAGNYYSLLVTPEAKITSIVVRLTDAQGHTFIRPPLIARARFFAPRERDQAAIYGIGVGMLALTILFHLSLFFAIRRRFQLIYCAHAGLLLVYGLCYSGLIRLVAPGLSGSAASDLLGFTMAAATGTGVAFIVEFISHGLPPWLKRWARASSVASLAAAIVLVAAPAGLSYPAYLAANAVAVHAILLTTGILALACWRRQPAAHWLALGWAMPITVSFMYPLRTLGLIPPGAIPDGLMMMASTLECLILSLPVAGRIRHLRVEHERAQERHVVLERQAQTDSLTGLANRRGFDEALTRAAAAQADPTPMAVLLIDIDHFKRVNDRYGHAAGDAILQHVASHVAKVAGAGAIVSRFGGAAVVGALRGYDLARAGTIAERIRKSVGVMLDATAKLPQVTVSIGVAAGHSAAMDAMLADADCALYRAKNEGRDRVIVADGPLMYAAAA